MGKNFGITIKVGFMFVAIYLVSLFAGTVFIHEFLLSDSKLFIQNLETRIAESLVFKDGNWDTSLYNADTHTPYPNSSAHFPVYIITQEGDVLERSQPIAGFLDTADKNLIQFSTPTTINFAVNENWRMFSQQIVDANQHPLGVVSIAYYNPEAATLKQIDTQLTENMSRIMKQIRTDGGEINLANFDDRQVDYLLSFQIVTNSNHIIWNRGRSPSFIDPSYLDSELNNKDFHYVQDVKTHENFLVRTQPITSFDGKAVGIMVVGRSTNFSESMTRGFVLAGMVFGLVILLLCGVPLHLLLSKQIQKRAEILGNQSEAPNIPSTKLAFDKDTGRLHINENSVQIALSSNQYFICEAIFSDPEKRWKNEELLDLMGKRWSEYNYKKVYDAVLAINKKLGFKLISYEDQASQLNPQFRHLVR